MQTLKDLEIMSTLSTPLDTDRADDSEIRIAVAGLDDAAINSRITDDVLDKLMDDIGPQVKEPTPGRDREVMDGESSFIETLNIVRAAQWKFLLPTPDERAREDEAGDRMADRDWDGLS